MPIMLIYFRVILGAEVCRSKNSSAEDQLALIQKCIALGQRISKHHNEAAMYLSADALAAILSSATIMVDDNWIDEDEEDGMLPMNVNSEATLPENLPIILPSNFSKKDRSTFDLKLLGKKELTLRQGQANDALQAIQLGIGEKSFRFRNNLRPATSKGAKTRAWTLINNAGKKLQKHRLIYRQAREAMKQLGAKKLVKEIYRELSNDDMKASTAIQESNARGQRNAELSWIWRTEGIFNGDEDAYVTECEP